MEEEQLIQPSANNNNTCPDIQSVASFQKQNLAMPAYIHDNINYINPGSHS